MNAVPERRKTDKRIKQISALHALFAQKTSRTEYLQAVVELLKEISGCQGVGMRMHNRQGEIPYEVSVGFDTVFLLSESRLSLHGDDCLCTRLFMGRMRPLDRSRMTSSGSFLCPNTMKLISELHEGDRKYYRGVCVNHGYASLALVPVRYRETMLGVIHFADRRQNVLEEDLVEFLETLTPLIGEASHRFDVEADLRESEERYRSLVLATTQIIWSTNPKGEVIQDIPSWRAFTGQKLEDAKGRGWADALHPDDREQTVSTWQKSVEDKSVFQIECRIRRADGVFRDFAVRGVPVYGPDKAIREWIGACFDISESKVAERKILDLNRSLGQQAEQLRALATDLTLTEFRERKYLAQILHDELQQLLAAGKIRVDLLGKNDGLGENGSLHLKKLDQVISESIKLCRTLITELSPPLLSEIGLVAAVGALARQMKDTHDLDVQLVSNYEIPADNEGICLLLFQAIRELLFNVVKHSGVKRALVCFSKRSDDIQIEVSDQGMGFDPEKANSRRPLPTGLGLFGIQERLVQKGGRITIDSSAGNGTRVILNVSIAAADQNASLAGLHSDR